jgi:hypothetical protein
MPIIVIIIIIIIISFIYIVVIIAIYNEWCNECDEVNQQKINGTFVGIGNGMVMLMLSKAALGVHHHCWNEKEVVKVAVVATSVINH